MQNGVNTGAAAKLTIADVEMIREMSPHVSGVNPQQDRSLQVVWGSRNINVQVTGTASNFLEVRGFRLAEGRMFTEAEDNARQRVAVIGGEVVNQLGVQNPATLLGEQMRIGGRMFKVVGVMANRGVSGVGDADNQILVPLMTGRFQLFGTDRLQDIWVRAIDEASLTDAMFETQMALRRSHRIPQGRSDDFTMRNQADFLTVLSETTATFTALLAGVAAVSLLVGGIGIMNIMLVSVTERTREIGIRKALGATRRNILLQFLIEAVVLCVAGGALGVMVGGGLSLTMRTSLGWDTAMSPTAVVLAFVFAAAVGVLFGVWPARRAALLDPIAALRYE
jgi:putative ABC transport system permease protein